MTEEVESLHTKLAFADVEEEYVGSKMLKESMQMACMLGAALTGHQDVIEVDKDKVQVLADNIHEALESLRGIAQTKRHSHVFEEPK